MTKTVLGIIGGSGLYDMPSLAITPMNCTFGEWLQAWVSGDDLWEALNRWLPSAVASARPPGSNDSLLPG